MAMMYAGFLVNGLTAERGGAKISVELRSLSKRGWAAG